MLNTVLKLPLLILLEVALFFCPRMAPANTAADGRGAGAGVSVTDHGDGTVTMTNGIASIVIVKKTGRLNSLAYTYDDEGTRKTCETLSGKGQYYYGGF